MVTRSRNASRFDVVIVGGGLIGCAIAREIAGRGRTVAVVERVQPGAEASSAAAGLLSPQVEAEEPGAFFDLALESRALHARWAQELTAETGSDVGYRRCGILRCSFREDSSLVRSHEWQTKAGLVMEPVDAAGVASRTGGRVSPDITEAVFFPDEAMVDAGLLTRAVAQSAERRGARILTETPVRRFRLEGNACVGVETDAGVLESASVVDAAGAWASFDAGLPLPIPVEPVRGQMIELSSARELATVVQDDDVYLVPRRGGRILVGATVERVGFRKQVTAQGLAGLLSAAIRLVPDLSQAPFVRAWAGLRPGTPDGLPILGPSPITGLFLATGHFRNGILLAPVTARLMADLLTGVEVRGLEPFSIDRFAHLRDDLAAAPPTTGVFS
jgi:glycine oxidase